MELSSHDYHLIASALASRINRNLELITAMNENSGNYDMFMLDLTMENLYLLNKIQDHAGMDLQRFLLNPKEVYVNLDKIRSDENARIAKSLGF